MRRVLAVVLVGGCGRIGFGDLIDRADAPSDAPARLCTMPAVFDSFDGNGPPCGTWGSPTNMTNSLRSGGALHVEVPGGTDVVANCVDGAAPFSDGTFVEISNVLRFASGFVQFSVNTQTFTAELDYYRDSGALEMSDELNIRANLGNASYDPVAMRWWRLRPNGGQQIVGEYSADGLHWTLLGTKSVSTTPAGVKLILGAGFYGTEGGSNSTVFEGWNVCPP